MSEIPRPARADAEFTGYWLQGFGKDMMQLSNEIHRHLSALAAKWHETKDPVYRDLWQELRVVWETLTLKITPTAEQVAGERLRTGRVRRTLRINARAARSLMEASDA